MFAARPQLPFSTYHDLCSNENALIMLSPVCNIWKVATIVVAEPAAYDVSTLPMSG
jgi:hypothetical protein